MLNYAHWRIAILMSLVGLMYGIDTGSIGPITQMPNFQNEVGKMPLLTEGLYVSSILLFAGLSSVGDGYLADQFSRKYTVSIGAALASIGALMSALSSRVPELFVARAIYGIGIGISTNTAVLYLVEIAPDDKRGLLASTMQLLITVGIPVGFFATVLGSKLSGNLSWRIPFILEAIVGVVAAIGSYFLPFSPRWLMQRDRELDAFETLLKLRHIAPTNHYGISVVNQDLRDIRNDIKLAEKELSISYFEIFRGVFVFKVTADKQ
jgi:MFS family permease